MRARQTELIRRVPVNTRQQVWPARRSKRRRAGKAKSTDYLPLSFSISGVDGLFIILSGAAVAGALESAGGVDVEAPLGGGIDSAVAGVVAGVLVADPLLVDEVDGLIVAVVGAPLVDGAGVDDGLITGGVVLAGLSASRWQPAAPSATPVQSTMLKIVRFMLFSVGGYVGLRTRVHRFSRNGATDPADATRRNAAIVVNIHRDRGRTRRSATCSGHARGLGRHRISQPGGKNYARRRNGRCANRPVQGLWPRFRDMGRACMSRYVPCADIAMYSETTPVPAARPGR